MKQVVQEVRSGKTSVREIPAPVAGPGQVVVATMTSLVSAGTERYVVDLARKSLVGKALERPDHVRRVLQKAKQEGLISTISQIRAKLDEPMPLGYSVAGRVLEVGRGVDELKPGDRVAAAAPHAGIVSVGRRLCARVPDDVSFDQAAYTSVCAIALEGVRRAQIGIGERILVIGLGLLGQIAVAILKAHGCRVFGTDLDPGKLAMATEMGADVVATGAPAEAVRRFSGGHGIDAVIITAATPSNQPVEFAAQVCRPKGRIVSVGVVGLDLPRPPFFEKELELTVSSSLGPGRGDPSYEERGIDYPIGHARWTAQRNMEAVLDLMQSGRLPVEKLTTHRFAVEVAERAYDLITGAREPYCGILIEYPEQAEAPRRSVRLAPRPAVSGDVGVSVVGAGNFGRLIMMPILEKLGGVRWQGMCSARGMHALHSGEKLGFAYATTDYKEILDDERTHALIVLTRHDLHAEMVTRALRAGKHVFVEKPLCISTTELDEIQACVAELGEACPVLMVGFNRRFARATGEVAQAFAGIRPLSVSFRFSTAELPPSSWLHDEEVGGGRLVGEACHAIDTCIAVHDSVPVKVHAESVSLEGPEPTSDRVFITMRHRNGGISSIAYQAGGARSGPKERVEVFGGGRTAVVEDWASVEVWRGEERNRQRGSADKGHAVEVAAFLTAARRGGPWPIPWDHLYGGTWAALMAVRSIREGVPQTLEPGVLAPGVAMT